MIELTSKLEMELFFLTFLQTFSIFKKKNYQSEQSQEKK